MNSCPPAVLSKLFLITVCHVSVGRGGGGGGFGGGRGETTRIEVPCNSIGRLIGKHKDYSAGIHAD